MTHVPLATFGRGSQYRQVTVEVEVSHVARAQLYTQYLTHMIDGTTDRTL